MCPQTLLLHKSTVNDQWDGFLKGRFHLKKRNQHVLVVAPVRRVTGDASQRQPQESLYAFADTRFMMETLNGQHIKATQLKSGFSVQQMCDLIVLHKEINTAAGLQNLIISMFMSPTEELQLTVISLSINLSILFLNNQLVVR